MGLAVAVLAAVVGASPLAWDRYRDYLDNRITPELATDADTHDILLAVLVDQSFDGIPAPPPAPGQPASEPARKQIVVIDQSLSICPSDVTVEGNECSFQGQADLYFHPAGPDIVLKFRRELVAGNSSPRALPKLDSPFVRFEPRDQVMAVFSGDGWWSDFYRKFPGTAGFVEVTWPVLSDDGKKALLYVGHSFDGLGGVGKLYLLVRDGQHWKVAATETLWVS